MAATSEWIKKDGHWIQKEVFQNEEWYDQLLRDQNEIVTRLTCDNDGHEEVDSSASEVCSEVIISDVLLSTTRKTDESTMSTSINTVSVSPEASELVGVVVDSMNENLKCMVETLERNQANMNDELIKLKKRLSENEFYMEDQYDYIENLEKRLNHLDQYGRRENIEIAGIPNHVSDDNLEREVVKILKKIGLTHIVHYNIVGCHRLRTKDKFGCKNVIVRFLNRKDAINSLKSRKNLASCAELGYRYLRIYENLCPVFRSIYENLQEEKSKGNISQVWTYNGIINYKLTDNETEKPKKIYVQNDFENLLYKLGGT